MVFSLFCILVGSLLAPPPPNKPFKLCFKSYFLVQSSAKESLKSAKTVVFSLYCILIGRPMGGGYSPPRPPPWLRYCLKVSPLVWSCSFICLRYIKFSLKTFDTRLQIKNNKSDAITSTLGTLYVVRIT